LKLFNPKNNMKKYFFCIFFCISIFSCRSQNAGFQNIERYRPIVGGGLALNFSFQKNNANYNLTNADVHFDISDNLGVSRINISKTSGITQIDSATIAVNLTYNQINSLVRDVYSYRIYTLSLTGISTEICGGAFRLVRGPNPVGVITFSTFVIKLGTNSTTSTTLTSSGGGSSGITSESDPTVTSTKVRDLLQALSGTNRLSASFIKDLPVSGGGGITVETDPLVPSYIKAITQTRLNTWDLAATQGGGTGFNSTLNYVQIGSGANGAATYDAVVIGKNASYTATWKSGVVIGWGASNNQQGGVTIGEGASGVWSNIYGCFDGSDNVSIGRWSRGYGWRTTALGAYAHAGGQSSTSVGAGSAALSSHSIALGRGAYAGNDPSCQNSLITQATTLYLSNGWAHRFPAMPTPEMETEYSVEAMIPNTRPVRIQAIDAFDARLSPSDFNVAGGTIRIAAGRGTGTGASGKVEILTSPVQNLGQNIKNPDVTAAQFDATNVTSGTYLLLYDPSAGTLKRVKMAAADGQGRKMLYLDN
jgi:hypothetical protein